MARDLPDWGALTAQATVHEVTDLGELAVRLGSIDSFDRRGDVLFMDNFEDGLSKWVALGSGDDNDVDIITTVSRSGSDSVILTAGKTTGYSAEIRHFQPYPALSRFGVEFSFDLVMQITQLELQVLLYDGTNRTRFYIKWSDVDNTIAYWDHEGHWIPFATDVSLAYVVGLFHTMKLVFDGNTQKYTRLLLNSAEYELDVEGQVTTPVTDEPRFNVYIKLTGYTPVNVMMYVDDAIITQNEPPNA